VFKRLPPSNVSLSLGKLLTRLLLRPGKKHQLVKARFAGRIEMELDLGDFTSNDLYCLDRHYESVTLSLWTRLARQAETVVDLGSHIGTYALMAADANPHARVFAVEANRANFERLAGHAAPYSNITPVQAAIADHHATLWFCMDPLNTGGGYLSETPAVDRECYPIETRTLGELCRAESISQVDLMKIDVEGYEYRLLTGADDFWRCTSPKHLIVEIARDTQHPNGIQAALRAMRARGYHARLVQSLHVMPWGHADDLANWHFWRA